MGNDIVFDKRYKYREKETKIFYLYIRNKKNHIYYARFRNGVTISTGCTSLSTARIFAQSFFNTSLNTYKKSLNAPNSKPKNDKITLYEILEKYYVKGSIYSEYDRKHGTNYTDKILSFNHSRMLKIAAALSDVTYPQDLTRNRLIKLQEELLNQGLSGKTVNNYLSTFHKIYNQLLDKEIIKDDPFTNLRPCSFEKQLRMCFPLQSVKGSFKVLEDKLMILAFVACATGMRRGEIERVQKEDIIEKNGFKWLKVRGTKTIYSVRDVPIFPELEKAIIQMTENKYCSKDFKRCVSVLGKKIGYDDDYIQQNGIVFHSFRKLYKTLLTQANLNTSLVEMLMGHTTQNQKSNDVERIYFVAESADLTKVWEKVTSELQYLI